MSTMTYQQKMKSLLLKRACYEEEVKQKKLEFKQQEEKIKGELFNNLTAILKAQNPFELDLETFLGGVLFVVSEMKQASTVTINWQQKGACELKRFQRRRGTHVNSESAPEPSSNVA